MTRTVCIRVWRSRVTRLALLFALGTLSYVALRLVTHAHAQQAVAYDQLQFDGTAQHGGDNTLEQTITAGNVHELRRLFRIALPTVIDGAPVYLHGVRVGDRTRDLLYGNEKNGTIAAFDALTGALIWQHGTGHCTHQNPPEPCHTTAMPAIDPNRQYVYAYGLDGFVHRYRVGNGVEVRGGGWPELVTRKPTDEKGSADLSVASDRAHQSYLYAVTAAYPFDNGDYQGHITAINLASGVQRVFNVLCSNRTTHFAGPGADDCWRVQAGIWGRPGVVYDADTDRIYVTTSNGPYDIDKHNWGNSVLALRPDATGRNGDPLDTYTPVNFLYMEFHDVDLGSTSPAILPVVATSRIKHLAIQSGKDGKLRLLNLDNLSGRGGPAHAGGELQLLEAPEGSEVLTQPAVWVDPRDDSSWVFVSNDAGIEGLRLTVQADKMPVLHVAWRRTQGGSSPLVANNVLYYAGNGALHALDPRSGQLLWQDSSLGYIHWESPIVVNGRLYVTDGSAVHNNWLAPSGHLLAFGLG